MNRERRAARYRAYLVRLWRSESGDAWFVSLERSDDRRRYGFADLEAAFAFLQQQLSDDTGSGEEASMDGDR